MQKAFNAAKWIAAVILTVSILFFFLVFSGVQTVYAATTQGLDYERSAVLDDLKLSSVNGEPFDLSQYEFNSEKPTQVLSLAEYCYAYSESGRTNFGLYVYVYNPQKRAFDFASAANRIQLAYGKDSASGYKKYALRLLNVTDDGKFAKYKIAMTDSRRAEMLAALDPAARVYSVSGIELKEKGEKLAEEFSVATTYTYTGYAEGYGQYTEAKSTLSCTRQEQETAELKVKGTYYRYAQDPLKATQINSVYFAVDNTLLKKYGTIYRIWAEYYQYNLAPILISQYQNVYDILNSAPIEATSNNFDYYFIGHTPNTATVLSYNCGWAYGGAVSEGNVYEVLNGCNLYYSGGCILDYKKPLAFLTDGQPGETFISREELFAKMYALAEDTGAASGELNDIVLRDGTYFPYATGYTPIDLTADDLFDIKGFTTGSSFFDWWYSLFHTTTQPIEGITPIYQVKPADLKQADICNDLLIAGEDKQAFIDYCTEAELNDKTVFLFRYGTSQYMELDFSVFNIPSHSLGAGRGGKVRFQTIDRDFDVIQLGFGNEKQLVIIPVVASPIDNLAGSQGIRQILKETDRGKGLPWWVIAIIIVLAVIVVLLLILPGRRRKSETANTAPNSNGEMKGQGNGKKKNKPATTEKKRSGTKQNRTKSGGAGKRGGKK